MRTVNNNENEGIKYISDKDQYWILRDLDNAFVLFGDIKEGKGIFSGREVLELYDTFEEMRDKALEYGVSQEEIDEMFPEDEII